MKAKISVANQRAEVEATNKEIESFFKSIMPDFVQEGGGILTDTVRFWRWKNQVFITRLVN